MTIQNIVIPTTNFEATVAFYRDILAMPVHQQSDKFCFLNAGTVNLAIHPVSEDNIFMPSGHGIYLDLIVDDLADTRARLNAASVAIVREWEEAGTTFVAVADPSGNLLELYQRSNKNGAEADNCNRSKEMFFFL